MYAFMLYECCIKTTPDEVALINVEIIRHFTRPTHYHTWDIIYALLFAPY